MDGFFKPDVEEAVEPAEGSVIGDCDVADVVLLVASVCTFAASTAEAGELS